MQYYSINNKNHRVSFKEAVISGLAPDKGLYFPEKITLLPTSFFETIETLSHEEIAFQSIRQFVGDDIPEKELRTIIQETLCFDFPCIPVEDAIFSLELFHGPTMAFKDVGARFMSRCLGYFNRDSDKKVTVLVATSGDTGGAVASGFLGVKGVEVVILYPSGKVSEIQEKQLTTFGQNIKALEVEGVFDDCQEMVKRAFLDESLNHKNLTSANSINIARWLPQMFYIFFAYQQLKSYGKPIVISCPSGNFGNICAGMVAKRLGLPISHFIATTNENDTVPRFLQNGNYEPYPTIATLSNAMDVSNPSNFVRIMELYEQDLSKLQYDFSAYRFSDRETEKGMITLYEKTKYISEPHGCIGYLGLQQYRTQNPDTIGVFLETAHPIKFADAVEALLNLKLEVPPQIEAILHKEKVKTKIKSYEDLHQILNQ